MRNAQGLSSSIFKGFSNDLTKCIVSGFINKVKELYFSKDNVMDVGLKRMEKIVFVQERTLLFYRKKYCEVVNAIFVLIEDFDFLNDFGTQPGSLS